MKLLPVIITIILMNANPVNAAYVLKKVCHTTNNKQTCKIIKTHKKLAGVPVLPYHKK
jgi:hypothetical protein